MRVGDRVLFCPDSKYFRADCDTGIIVERIEDRQFRRPWKVRWDTGIETRP